MLLACCGMEIHVWVVMCAQDGFECLRGDLVDRLVNVGRGCRTFAFWVGP